MKYFLILLIYSTNLFAQGQPIIKDLYEACSRTIVSNDTICIDLNCNDICDKNEIENPRQEEFCFGGPRGTNCRVFVISSEIAAVDPCGLIAGCREYHFKLVNDDRFSTTIKDGNLKINSLPVNFRRKHLGLSRRDFKNLKRGNGRHDSTFP